MKIYYAHSIKGGHTPGERTPQDIIPILQQAGHEVLSEEFYTQGKSLTPQEIYQRDTEMLRQSDIILANITNPSLGVGYEIGYAESLGKKIVCFYQSELKQKTSGMITGNSSFESYPIKSIHEILDLL